MHKKKHCRIAVKEIHPTPANGIYVTKEDLRKYGAFAGLLFFLLACAAVFGKKG